MDLDNMETALPGVITKVNKDGTVFVRPVIRKIEPNGVFDIVNLEIPNVPLMKLGGANAEFSFSSNEGDQVLLVAFSRDASEWKRSDDDDIVPTACSGLTMNDVVAIPVVKSTKDGAAKIRVTDDGDIEMEPKAGRRVVAVSDLICKGNLMAHGNVLAVKDVGAGCAQLPDDSVVDVPVAYHLSNHTQSTAVGPTSAPTTTPPTM